MTGPEVRKPSLSSAGEARLSQQHPAGQRKPSSRHKRLCRSSGQETTKDRTLGRARSFGESLPLAGANRGSGRRAAGLAMLLRLHRSLNGTRGLDGALHNHATAAAAVAAVATMAAAMATMTAAVAAVAARRAAARRAAAATMAAAVAAMAAVAAVAAAAAIAATTSEQQAEGRSLVFTAHEGDTNQREKDRNTEHYNAVHPRFLQLLTGTGKREHKVAVITEPHLAARRPKR